MKRSQQAEKAILHWIEQQKHRKRIMSSSCTGRKGVGVLDVEEVTAFVQTQNPRITEENVDKALQRLVEKGKISKQGEDYYYFDDNNNDSNDVEIDGGEANDDAEDYNKDEDDDEQLLTAAEIMRRKLKMKATQSDQIPDEKQTLTTNAKLKNDTVVDIDEEIRRLEQELASASDENESNMDSMVDDNNNDGDVDIDESSYASAKAPRKRMQALKTDDIAPPDGVLCLSEVAAERIEALPSSCLPAKRKRVLKAIDSTDHEDISESKKKQKKKKVTEKSQSDTDKRQMLASEGLAGTIREVLDGYVARSAERLPFYCRVCAKQYSNEEEFLNHRKAELHKSAAELDRKASYCKLCRKQFTSPEQMKEHLSSRPHKERLEFVKSKQSRGGGDNNSAGQSRYQQRSR